MFATSTMIHNTILLGEYNSPSVQQTQTGEYCQEYNFNQNQSHKILPSSLLHYLQGKTKNY
jgi:hypothetical protein